MKNDYTSPDYDKYRIWINEARENNWTWDQIENGNQHNEEGLERFLQEMSVMSFWNINAEDFKAIVALQKEKEEKTKRMQMLSKEALIVDDGEDNDTKIPQHPDSSWQLYRKRLIEDKHFKENDVDEIEKSTIRILRRLNKKTLPGKAVKGLVIGNVQSGKTANIAALMAMSADWGWNMFIVLSGTIENLRKQTQSRLFDDLHERGNLRWTSLEHLSKQSPEGQRAQDLHFEDGSDERYFTVCLKNSVRLKKMIQWLQADPKKQKQMKVLLIDDEADQAGINTAKIYQDEDLNERRKINQLLVNLVGGKNEKGKKTNTSYMAMNYIGYTATPYANVLNESGEASLYPRSFIATLGVSKEYFGPQQIFGVSNGDYEGLDIVRTIDQSDLNEIKEIHNGENDELPVSLQKAICWFIDGVACRRLWKAHKPVSMLIHTSQKTDCHANIANAINDWFEFASTDEIISLCEDVWEEETERFSLETFEEEYPDYDIPEDSINDYPSFDEIEPYIEELIKENPTHISLGEDGEFEYTDGIHICVDNCKNNGITDDGMYMRLAYPTDQKDLDKAPAFIVIGGQTLSRGLTLEGLICTYFLRSVGQADTLMQMGRWFGYKKGYELLVRIWMTQKTFDQFRFLSDLDQDLRDEISNMDITGQIPATYGPRVKNTPDYSFIRITSKNRMQSAQATDMDYSGTFIQTYLFDDNYEILHSNLEATMNLLKKLGQPEKIDKRYKHAKNAKVWRNIDFSVIKRYLQDYILQKNMHIAGTLDNLIEWIEEITQKGNLESWNVVLSNRGRTDATISTPVGSIHLATRTRRKKIDKLNQGIIDIGVLRAPDDLLADVDYDKLSDEQRDLLKECKTGQIKAVRNKMGLEKTPQLIIYLVDKNSKVRKKSESRIDLNAPENIAGYCLNIPGGAKGANNATTVSIKMDNNIFDGEADLEDANED